MSYTPPPGYQQPPPGYYQQPPQKKSSHWPWIIGICVVFCAISGGLGYFLVNKVSEQVKSGPQIIMEERILTQQDEDKTGFGRYAMENLGVTMDLPAKPKAIEMDALDLQQKLTYAKVGMAESDDPDLPYRVHIYEVEYFPLTAPDSPAEVGDNFVQLFEDFENIAIKGVQRSSFPTNQMKGQRIDMNVRWDDELVRIVGWGGWRGKQGVFFYVAGDPSQEKAINDAFNRIAESMFMAPMVPTGLVNPAK